MGVHSSTKWETKHTHTWANKIKKVKVLPGLEPGSKDSESLVITNYTTGPWLQCCEICSCVNRFGVVQSGIPFANHVHSLPSYEVQILKNGTLTGYKHS